MHALQKRSANIREARFAIAQRGPGGFGQHISGNRLQSLQGIRPVGDRWMGSERLSCGYQIE